MAFDGVYRGPFCTGHTFFPMQAVNFYTETLSHEFREEYKQAHNIKTPTIKPTEVPSLPQRHQPIRLPLTGTPTSRAMPGGRPPRREPLSSGVVGGWWNDPIFSKIEPMRPSTTAPRPPGQDLSSSSDYGRYWHDSKLNQIDSHTEALRVKNGVKRVCEHASTTLSPLNHDPSPASASMLLRHCSTRLTDAPQVYDEATLSRFTLEALPIEHRLL